MKRQTGFSAVEALLTLLIAAVIGFGGYYVWHTQHDKNSKTTNSTSTAKPTSTSTSTSAQKYFTIKEWGIRSPYDGKLHLEYKITPSGEQGGGAWTEYASFSSTELDGVDPSCKQSSNYGGIIQRYKSNDNFLGEAGQSTGVTAAEFAKTTSLPHGQVGGYYYFYTQPNGTCTVNQQGENEDTAGISGQTMNDVKSILSNLQALPN